MSYRVIWRERLLRRLHDLAFITLEHGGDAGAITRAVDELTRRWKGNPRQRANPARGQSGF